MIYVKVSMIRCQVLTNVRISLTVKSCWIFCWISYLEFEINVFFSFCLLYLYTFYYILCQQFSWQPISKVTLTTAWVFCGSFSPTDHWWLLSFGRDGSTLGLIPNTALGVLMVSWIFHLAEFPTQHLECWWWAEYLTWLKSQHSTWSVDGELNISLGWIPNSTLGVLMVSWIFHMAEIPKQHLECWWWAEYFTWLNSQLNT